jgi:hypothetical protein
VDAELEDTKVLRVQANTKIEGVVIPTKLAFVLVVLFALLFVPPIVVFYKIKHAEMSEIERDRTLSEAIKRLDRETRILAVHAQDIENVLIRQGVAKRDDFAPWEPSTPVKPSGGE